MDRLKTFDEWWFEEVAPRFKGIGGPMDHEEVYRPYCRWSYEEGYNQALKDLEE